MSTYTVNGENFKRFLDLTVKHDGSVRERWHALIVYGLVCYSGEGNTPSGGKPNKGDPGILTDVVTKMTTCKAQGVNNVKEWVKAHSALVWNDTKNGFTTRQREEKGAVTLPMADDDRYWTMGKKNTGSAKAVSPLDRISKLSASIKAYIDGDDKAPEMGLPDVEKLVEEAKSLLNRVELALIEAKKRAPEAQERANPTQAADLADVQREHVISTVIAHVVKYTELPAWTLTSTFFETGISESEAHDIQAAFDLAQTKRLADMERAQAKRLADIERAKEIIAAEPKTAPVGKPKRRARIVTHNGIQSRAALATNPEAPKVNLPHVESAVRAA
jgi:hypothetical protein